MGTTENKELVRELFEQGFNEQRREVLDRVIGDDYVNHDMPTPAPGVEGFAQVVGAFWSAFSEARVEVEEIVAEGDLVATRGVFTGTHHGEFMGVPASGAAVRVPYMDFWRIEDGRARENWVRIDSAALMQQIGGSPGQ